MGALLAGLRAVPVPVDDEWHLDLDARRSRRRRRARSCSGSTTRATRPASTATPDGMRDAVAWARARGIIVASDECYAEFTYDADGAPDRAGHRARSPGTDGVLAVHSLSKRSNMAGLRAGFVAGDRDARHATSARCASTAGS